MVHRKIRYLLMLVLITIGCQPLNKKKNSSVESNEPLAFVNDHLEFFFDETRAYSFQLRLKNREVRPDDRFQMDCNNCPVELTLSESGYLNWTPQGEGSTSEKTNSYFATFKVTDGKGKSSKMVRSITTGSYIQKGDFWDAEPVDDELLQTIDDKTTTLVKSIGERIYYRYVTENHGNVPVRSRAGGTGFFLGQHAGAYIISTVLHAFHNIAPDEESSQKRDEIERSCNSDDGFTTFYFPIEKVTATCKKIVWVAPRNLDSIFVEVSFDSEEDAKKLGILNLGPSQSVKLGTQLISAGFGGVNNPYFIPTLKRDHDCRLLATTPSLQVDSGDIWLLPTACDTSFGDSGSPVMNRLDDSVIGLMTRGSLGIKSSSSDFVKLSDDDNIAIWKKAGSHFVPTNLIYDAMAEELDKQKIAMEYVPVLNSLFSSFTK